MGYTDPERVIAWLADGHGDKLTTLDRAVLVTIAHDSNSRTGLYWKGVEYLATVWGVDSRSIKRAITRLGRLGHIETPEPGTGQRRARYRLAGELMDSGVGGHSGPPTPTEVGGPSGQSRGTEVSKKGDPSVPRIKESSRSYSGVMTIDGATPRPPLGSVGAAPANGRKISEALGRKIRETLGYTEEEAAEWIETKLDGRTVNNVDAYLLQSLKTQVADNAKAAAKPPTGRSSAKKATPAKKTAAKKTAAGKPKRKRAGTPCKADGCDTNLVTAEAEYTGYCAKHQRENREHCKTEDCRGFLYNVREMKSGYCTKHLAADFTHPPVWSETIQTDALRFIIERRPTLDEWANLLLKADIPGDSTANDAAAAKAGSQLFQAIRKGLYEKDCRVWSNAMHVDVPDNYFDFRVDDIRRIVANGHIQLLARQLSNLVKKGTAA